MNKKIAMFIDMDGTLAEWGKGDGNYKRKGYFISLGYEGNVYEGLALLSKRHPEIMMFALSVAGFGSEEQRINVEEEKNQWLDKAEKTFGWGIDKFHRIFVAEKESKWGVASQLCGDDTEKYLLDDYFVNIFGWKGTAIKVKNHVNGKTRTYQNIINSIDSPEKIADDIEFIIFGEVSHERI